MVSSEIIVSQVTFSSQELALRLNQNWRFLSLKKGQLCIDDEAVAAFEKRGANVWLRPIARRDYVRWTAWAIQSICPGAEARDEEAEEPLIAEEPIGDEEAAKAGQAIVAARLGAIAKEADAEGRAYQAVVLLTYLVKKELLEVGGPMAAVAKAVFPLLEDVKEGIGAKLEDVLLDLDEVEELYADGEQLEKIVLNSDHIFDR